MNKLMQYFLTVLLLSSCATDEQVSEGDYTAYTGASIIDGSGDQPIENGVLLIREGKVTAVGSCDDVSIPEEAHMVDLTGKFIIPGLINGHGHVGQAKGIEGDHYSAQNVLDNLGIYARYGITTVVSLGDDQKDGVPFRHVNDSLPVSRARLFIAGKVITGNTPEDAIADIEYNHQMGVDFMKIRVDDNLGTSDKMPEDVYRAVIDRSHELGYKIATHMYELDDSRKLVKAGSDLLAHSIRDQVVDHTFLELLKQKNIGYCPTLTRELSTYVYADTAHFFSDPFFLKEYPRDVIQPLMDPKRQEDVRNKRSAQIYKQQLPVAYTNLKSLHDAGIPIVFGTDSGVPTRFMGYFEHLEMEMMAEAGLTPMEILLSATKNVAEYLDLKGLGILKEGNWADFIILDADPLLDIRNCKQILQVYIGGKVVEESF
ncbi:amidohydrolase family protein [Anditalea andensis]|uniref:Amidohydrolase-related domain-containing protein n=1 Tax=Anditalea andensis TaxID=1048983 RepID=A0A074LKF1_9BACT|nr:amidohydrolase family protein [Anditalea andensis]KEO74307.1 hypothetical protein EL17_09250 [Anditalea andensis]